MTFSSRPNGIALASLLIAAVATACAEQPDQRAHTTISVQELTVPGAAGAAQPSLAPMADGRVLMSWQEPVADGHALRLATLNDTTWSAPVTVASERPFIVNWADFPTAVALGPERLAVHWLEREGADTYAYGVRIAFSDDGGRTWTAPVRPHRDSTETEHGFVSMLPTDGGALEAIWLDGRNFATDRKDMTLRSARVAPDGVSDEQLLDARICDCCQTDAARTGDGTIVVYRDRSAQEIRDIAAVRKVGGVWSDPVVVHDDGWHIDGCPVNGPAVAAHGDRVAVAWYTAARDSARVRLAFSSDGGRTFGDPVRVDAGDPAGRVDVVMLDDGRALVSWIESRGDGGELLVRVIGADGAGEGAGEAVSVASLSASRASGFPRMARSGAHVVLAWHDAEAEQVRVARLTVD